MKKHTPVDEWLLKQINERVNRKNLIVISKMRHENGSVKQFPLSSLEIPKISYYLKHPGYSPFVGYSLLAQYLRRYGQQPKVKRGSGQSANRILHEEAWHFMEDDGKKP